MTKEELKQEAEELYEDWYAHKLGAISIVDVICKMAEPREKQIKIDAKQIRALQKTNGALTDRVRELEDKLENYLFNYTKLERKYKSRCDKFNELDNLYEKLILENKELEAQVKYWKAEYDKLFNED